MSSGLLHEYRQQGSTSVATWLADGLPSIYTPASASLIASASAKPKFSATVRAPLAPVTTYLVASTSARTSYSALLTLTPGTIHLIATAKASTGSAAILTVTSSIPPVVYAGQKVKVQHSKITYSPADTATPLEFNIDGSLILDTPLSITSGGTGGATAATALNALLPSQTGNTGFVLTTDGTVANWGPSGGSGGGGTGTVTAVSATGSNGITITGSPITTFGTLAFSLGSITPTSVTATGTVTGTNLSGTNTGDQTITLTGDVTGTGSASFATTLASTGVTAGTYNHATITVDSKGRVISASSGSGGTGTVTSVTVNGTAGRITSSGSPVTTTGSITVDLATSGVAANTYGSGTQIPVFTVDAYGRITSVTNTSVSVSTGTVTSVSGSGGTTGLTLTGGAITTSGTLTIGGTLNVAAGGTGATTLSGILKGNGTSAVTSAVAGTDYVAPGTATTYTVAQTVAHQSATATAGASYSWITNTAQMLQLTFSAGNISTFSATGTVAGTFYALYLKQDSVGSRTVAWSGFTWANGTAPVLSTAANAVDIFTFYYDGTSMNCVGASMGVA